MTKVVNFTELPFLRVAACSYEGSLFGWKVEENAVEMELKSNLAFGFHASVGSLKAIACSASGKFLVTGGMDERIRIFNMFENKAVGELSQHTGAITSLKFYKDAYLLSSSEVWVILCTEAVVFWFYFIYKHLLHFTMLFRTSTFASGECTTGNVYTFWVATKTVSTT